MPYFQLFPVGSLSLVILRIENNVTPIPPLKVRVGWRQIKGRNAEIPIADYVKFTGCQKNVRALKNLSNKLQILKVL